MATFVVLLCAASLHPAKDRATQRRCAVGERIKLNIHGTQHAEVHVGHSCFAVAPVGAVLQAKVSAAGDECRQILWIVCRAGTAAKQDDRIVEHAAVTVFVFRETIEEMSQLLTQEMVILREFQLPVFVACVRQTVVGSREAQLEWKRIADSHAVFAIQHERD